MMHKDISFSTNSQISDRKVLSVFCMLSLGKILLTFRILPILDRLQSPGDFPQSPRGAPLPTAIISVILPE